MPSEPLISDQANTAAEDPTAARARLFQRLDMLAIAHETIDHPPIMTVEEGRDYKKSMPGGHTKNLFLKDKKANLYLASVHCDTKVDLVALGKAIGARGRLSFGKPDLMVEVLGVTPGSVTPFALINPGAKRLSCIILDRSLMAHEAVWFHPLQNTASTKIDPHGLVAFIEDCGHAPRILDLAAPLGDVVADE